jgi:carboxypeptidase C (cathepsin A)
VELNGVILISVALDFQTILTEPDTRTFRSGTDLPFMVYLPTYAATAWYHGMLQEDLQAKPLRDLLDEVEEFALGEYWTALALGDRLNERPDLHARVLSKLEAYTGLDLLDIDRSRLRIHSTRFCKQLLRSRERTVGRLDSRYLGVDRFPDGDRLETDPSGDQMMGQFTAALNHHLRNELGYENESFYKSLSMEVNESWDYEDFKGRYVNTSESLRDLLARSPRTRVFVANGYFDLATPHFATEHTFAHMGLDPSVRGNVRTENYEAGHMMYVHRPSLEAMAGHLREFITAEG